jgi:hypothetical protein
MIARYKDNSYLDIDSITCMYWEGNKGTIIVRNGSISVNWNTFNRIKEAFIWTHMNAIYDFRDVSSDTYKKKERKD